MRASIFATTMTFEKYEGVTWISIKDDESGDVAIHLNRMDEVAFRQLVVSAYENNPEAYQAMREAVYACERDALNESHPDAEAV